MEKRGLPGSPVIWVLITSEVLVFSAVLCAFLVVRLLRMEEFRTGAHLLHAGVGTLSMAVLLSSGYLAAKGQQAAERGRIYFLAAAGLGAAFLALKFLEYRDLSNAPLTFDGNQFFELYFLITGFHAAHVLFGMMLLLLVSKWPRRDYVQPAVAFWHMVDLIWVLVFPVIYLVPR